MLLAGIQKGVCMVDDVLINKAASIERGVTRARQEYEKDPASFATDVSRQDAAIMNIQRACTAALDLGQHLIRRDRLGVPRSAGDVFELLAKGGWVGASLLASLKNMVGFCNVAVHEHETLQLPITVSIITKHLGDLLAFSSHILSKDASSESGKD